MSGAELQCHLLLPTWDLGCVGALKRVTSTGLLGVLWGKGAGGRAGASRGEAGRAGAVGAWQTEPVNSRSFWHAVEALDDFEKCLCVFSPSAVIFAAVKCSEI